MVMEIGDQLPVAGNGGTTTDTGCELARSCLDCPFEHCLQEAPGGAKGYLMAQRDALIAARFNGGKGTGQIARELGVSQRTVQRSLKRERSRCGC